MSGKVSALQALEMMHALLSYFSAKQFSDNREYEAVNAAEVAELKADSFDSNDEETVVVLCRTFGNEENMGQSHDKSQPAHNTDADAPQPVRNTDESIWMLAVLMCALCKLALNNKT